MRSFAPVVLALVVLGCTPPHTIRVTNGLNTVMGLHVDRDIGTRGWQDNIVLLRPGQAREVLGGAVFNDDGRLRMRLNDCDYEYDVPSARPTSQIKWPRLLGARVRFAPDSTPELVAVVGGHDADGQFRVEQLDDDPVRPTKRVCAEPISPS